MSDLLLYDHARSALGELARFDEVKEIRDKAVALQAYAAQAKDGEMIGLAVRVRRRAERRCGELLRDMGANGERAGRGRPKISPAVTISLKELGVTQMQSSRWQGLARLDDYEFEARIAAAAKEAEKACVSSSAERQAEKRARRAARERELGAKIAAWPTKRYGVIYCDPAWKFETHSENGLDRAADNHYPTMTLDAIMALDVPGIAADDCALFMWVTAPFLRAGFTVMEHWGFEYKSRFVWDKEVSGNGYWVLDNAEELLIGVRGDVPCPAMGDLKFQAMHRERKGRHSAKPEHFAQVIESYFPSLPKIELNRRGAPRPGWDAWGNEAEDGEG